MPTAISQWTIIISWQGERMKKTLAFLLAFVSLFACVACKPQQEEEEQQQGVVVTGGNASPTEGYELTTEIGAAKDYVIVIRDDATKAEEYAARWMSNSIYEVTGVSVATQNEKTNFKSCLAGISFIRIE